MIRFRDVCSVYQPDIVFCMTKGDRTGLAYRLVQTYRSIILLFHPWIPVFDLLVLGVGIHGVEEECTRYIPDTIFLQNWAQIGLLRKSSGAILSAPS